MTWKLEIHKVAVLLGPATVVGVAILLTITSPEQVAQEQPEQPSVAAVSTPARTEPDCYGLGEWKIQLMPGRKSTGICWPKQLTARDAPHGIDFVLERDDPSVEIYYYTIVNGEEQDPIVHGPGKDMHVALPDLTSVDMLRVGAEHEVIVTLKMTPTQAPR